MNTAQAWGTRRTPVLFVLLLTLLTAGLVTVGARPALADTSLCSGNSYSTCTNAGYTDHGYGANNGNMYWSEFSGHNCTNYVAYVEIQNGFSTQNGYNPGNADNWGSYFSSRNFTVNGTPAVGSVAWWNDNQGPAFSTGHVAYVEAVHKDANGNVTSIDISEDNWQYGPFDWKNIPVGSSNYPVGNSTTSGFIHLHDLLSPQVTGQPVVVTNPDGSLSAYARGTDGTLKTTWQFGYGTNWHTFVSLGSAGGGFTSNPVITQDSKNGGAQSAFMIGSDGALWTSWQSSYGSTWSAWTSLGTAGGVTVTGQPVVITNPDGSLSAFALGSDHNLKTTWQYGYGTNWHSWVSLGSPSGNLQGTPVIMQDSKNGGALSLDPPRK